MTATTALPERVREYLGDPSLAPLWSRARDKLERHRLAVVGVVTVELDATGADRLRGLLGRRVNPGTVRVKLPALDEALRRSSAAAGLITVLTQLGGALTDRVAVREHRDAGRSEVWNALDAGLAAAGLAEARWVQPFLEGLRRSGLLTRAGVDTAQAAVGHAGAVLAVLAGGTVLTDPGGLPEPRWELAELAGLATGDAHGLDDGRLAAALVLRVAAAAAGEPVPGSAAERRTLWTLLGVTTDQVSGTVLVWGLRPPGPGRWAAMMRERADQGLITHLTLHELRVAAEQPMVTAGQRVFGCENPQVLQAAARAGVPGPLVCFSGNPASAGLLLLTRLLDAGAQVLYHGDFDWPGVRIAARLVRRGAGVWRMGADDYRDAVRRVPSDARLQLSGLPAETPWDDDLSVIMSRTGTAVHEEALLTALLADLQ